nr:hypothetical protein [Tanacetum cinerariifolium]
LLSLIPIQDNDSQREEIDIITNTDDVLPLDFENDDLEEEIDAVKELHVDNSVSNSEHELSDDEASDFDNPSFLRPPPELPDAEFDFKPDSEEEIPVVMNDRDEFDVSNNEDEITKSDFYFEQEICLIENLLYDNSSSRPLKEHNAEEECIRREHAEYISRMEMLFTINSRPRPMVNANTIVESILLSLIPIQDNDSQREEIDIITNT